jgi:hypothetical protein
VRRIDCLPYGVKLIHIDEQPFIRPCTSHDAWLRSLYAYNKNISDFGLKVVLTLFGLLLFTISLYATDIRQLSEARELNDRLRVIEKDLKKVDRQFKRGNQ